MQTYIHYGFGFPASHLTDEEGENLWTKVVSAAEPDGKMQLSLVPFTEDWEGKDWATVILIDYGRIPNSGKLATLSELNTLFSSHSIDDGTIELIRIELRKYNLEKYFDKVQPIIFSDNY